MSMRIKSAHTFLKNRESLPGLQERLEYRTVYELLINRQDPLGGELMSSYPGRLSYIIFIAVFLHVP